jgi:NADH dehydrogenase FAD-containing subunit
MVVQALCPVLLALGLLARPAALAMLLQALLMPVAGDTSLFWAALLLRVVVLGPGPLSIDRLLQRGAESLALPGAAALHDAFAWGRRVLGPIYLLCLRLWLAAAPLGLALAALSVTPAMQPGIAFWLPNVPSMVAALAPWLALLLAVLLAVGVGTRLAAVVLLVLVPLSQLTSDDVRLYWALLLAVVALQGAGPYSIDFGLASWLGRMAAPLDRTGLPHVVVVGGGFGGVATVRGLHAAPCRIALIDQRNYHLFQPLLYQVATASLSPADIATPVRGMFRGQANVRVLLGQVTGVDAAAKTVLLDRGAIPYDHLVLATGARHSYSGRDDWARFAPGLKSIEDSTAIRRRLLLAFEEAESAATEAERCAWLTFVIVGGGPTGVELAGAIAELARHGLDQEFREIDPASAQVVLLQSGSRLLPAFPEALSREAERTLRQLGVDVRLDRKVEAVAGESVTVAGEIIPTRTVLWAAGVMASPAAAWLGVAADCAGRVPVGEDMAVPGRAGVYVIGDTAASTGWAGKPVPGLAPAAKQGGAYVARVIRARLTGRSAPGPFRYRHLGSLATIGRQSAVADFGFVQIRGALAWWLWGAAHITFLVGGQNRVTVLVQWLWAYLTFRRGTRLITDGR